MGNTSILIRVQARGGKFLGPDINFSHVWVKDALNDRPLAHGPAGSGTDDSGNLCPDASVTTCPNVLPANGSSTGIVLTYDDPSTAPTVRYLTSDTGTASFLATFDLDQPTLLEISAAGADLRYTGSVTMWAIPGMQLIDPPGFVIEIPGLAVTIKQAAPNTKGQLEVLAHVTMMCGCPIDDAKTAKNPAFIPWLVGEFQVDAQLWRDKKIVASESMQLIATSQFKAVIPMPSDTKHLTLWVTAVQPKAANVGAASAAVG